MSRYLDPTNDIAFKKLFGAEEHKHLLISFLNAILDLKGSETIQQVELLPQELAPQILGEKKSILDVKCKDRKGRQYVVEMQNRKVPGFVKRSQYYAAHTYVTQSLKGLSHLELKPVILLAVANHTLFSKKEAVVSYHKTLDLKTFENNLEDLSYVFIELPKFKKVEGDLSTIQDKWIYFFKNWNDSNHIPSDVEEPEILEAYNAMEVFNWSLGEQEAYLKANIALTEEHAIKKEEFDRGLFKGNKEGHEKGHKEGREEGHKEGREEGRLEERRKVAKGMLALGLLKDQVKKITDLSLEDLEGL